MNRKFQITLVLATAGTVIVQPLLSPVMAMANGLYRQGNVQSTEYEQPQTFEEDGLIYKVINDSQVSVMAADRLEDTELSIPAEVVSGGVRYSVVKIESMVFMGMKNLENVYLPSTMEEVSEAAFISCPKLQTVFFSEDSDRAVLIKNGAFENCGSLEAVVLPDYEVSMQGQVFTGTESVSLYRWHLDTGADLDEYQDLYMGLYENRGVTVPQQEETDEEVPLALAQKESRMYSSGTAQTADSAVSAAGWLMVNGEYRYLKEDGKVTVDQMVSIAGKTYYFDSKGSIYTGWLKKDGSWYYFFKNGTMATDTTIENCYLDHDGIWRNYTWTKTDAGWTYGYDALNIARSGWRTINGLRYYFNDDGIMQTGWLEADGNTYFLRSDGSMARDCYVDIYYLDKEGKWNSNLDKPHWQKQDGKWWFRHPGGTCTRNGWEEIDGHKYFFDEEGYMQTGWIAWNGNWYYCSSSGEQITDKWIGDRYVDKDGIWSDDKWMDTEAGRMYRFGNGTYAKGWTTINGKRYYFNTEGILQTGWKTIDGKVYFLDTEQGGAELSHSGRYKWTGSGWTYSAGAGTLHGVDISHWQNGIDASVIPADFIIAKATGGTGFSDASFTTYAQQAMSSGKLFGMYHFARDNGYEGSAKAEAEFFYSAVKDYIGWGVPILDWEKDMHLGPEWVMEFLNRFYELSGVKCMVYMSASVTRAYNWSSVQKAGYPLWLAQYANMENSVGYQDNPWRDSWGNGAFNRIAMHQYTSRGKLPGYNGNLDLNVFYGSRSDWENLAKKK